MNPQDIIAGLRDIHTPPEPLPNALSGVSSLPIYFFLVLLLVLFICAWWRRNFWRRQAQHELKRIDQLRYDGALSQAWADLALLLRRISICAQSGEVPVASTEDQWLAWLDQLFHSTEFQRGVGRGLLVWPYSKTIIDNASADDLAQLVEHVQRSIKHVRFSTKTSGAASSFGSLR